MYKCTECGMEYEVKPDYCDCGNDEFVITVEEKKEDNVIWEEENGFGYPIDEKSYENNKKIQQKEAIKEKTKASEPEICRPKQELPKTDPISLIIFLICLILSIVILFLPVKTDVIEQGMQNADNKITKEIPPIDKFWNNTLPPSAEIKPPIPEPVAVKVVQPKANTVKKPVQTQKTTPKQTVVKLQKSNNVQTVQKPKKTEAEIRAEAERKALENAKKLEEVKKHAEDLQKAMYDKQEYANYKANLRNTIGRRVDFTKVIGDGDCAISFKIDPNGRLINGAFAKQSDNMTLNDAVYKAFMSSRNFTAPPDGYKNETLKLYVKFFNGNYEISLQ